MLKTYFLIAFFLVNLSVFGQSYKITYKIDVERMEERTKEKLKPEQQKYLLPAYAYLKKLTPTLYVKNNETIYSNEEKMDKDIDQGHFFEIAKVIAGTHQGPIYQNLETKETLKPQEFLGENFLVKYPFEEFDWEIKNEFETIKGIKAQKAVAWVLKSENKDDKAYIEAWFTPEIPISSGPIEFGGLPGLIIKLIKNDTLTLILENVEESPTEEITIEKPKENPIGIEEFYKQMEELTQKSPYGDYIGN